jgi:hypothetical protein
MASNPLEIIPEREARVGERDAGFWVRARELTGMEEERCGPLARPNE